MEFLLAIIILALDIFAVVHCLGTPMSTVAKVLWILAIIIFPVVGLIAYALYYNMAYRSRSYA
jgi:hypothetical protein